MKGFQRSKSELTLYVMRKGASILIVSVYTNDLIFIGNDGNMIQEFKKEMMKAYAMSDLGLLNYFLGIEVSQTKFGIFISQKKYVKTILKKFDIFGHKSVSTLLDPNQKLKKDNCTRKANATMYRSLMGSHLYMIATKPNLMFVATLLSLCMHKPNIHHFGARKRVPKVLARNT